MKKAVRKIATFAMIVDLFLIWFVPKMVGAELMKSILGFLIYWALFFILFMAGFTIYNNR